VHSPKYNKIESFRTNSAFQSLNQDLKPLKHDD